MRAILILCLSLLTTPLWAVQPDEILDDPAMEAQAREISRGLRCLVCRNESIDDSNADLARDLRLLVRERLVAGDTPEETVDFIVDRYGEYVLLEPTRRGANMILWVAGPVLLVVAAGIGLAYQRRNRLTRETAVAGLSPEEEARLKTILDD